MKIIAKSPQFWHGGHLWGSLWMGQNYAGIRRVCFADDRDGDDEDDDNMTGKVNWLTRLRMLWWVEAYGGGWTLCRNFTSDRILRSEPHQLQLVNQKATYRIRLMIIQLPVCFLLGDSIGTLVSFCIFLCLLLWTCVRLCCLRCYSCWKKIEM